MLELKGICKRYVTQSFTQVALDSVSLSFRDNEFVAILGPSGSGKTTMLNVIGGLDHFDSGDLLIDGISTKDFHDRDWDAYRNNRIGFVFQSYNLIPHQTILENVELALTLTGVGHAERRQRAREALEKVGLGEHVNKRPSQLSGGQMQRVAIARALINDPEIVLADEPTGALDSTTSVQVMDLLKEVARDRLVIMVTHNPDLAYQYATRIVNLADGKITDDSDPFDVADATRREAKPTRKTSMSFVTALGLSARNLMTKKGRTAMTAFAGSIGIIGIAAILALSNGVNGYIKKVEEDTLSSYPLTISKQDYDLSSMMGGQGAADDDSPENVDSSDDSAETDKIPVVTAVKDMFASVKSNDMTSFKAWLDDGGDGIDKEVNAIQYGYGVSPVVYRAGKGDEKPVRLVPNAMTEAMSGGASSAATVSMESMGTSVFNEMIDDQSLLDSQYDVVAGHWPTSANEAVMVLSSRGTVGDYTLYSIGALDIDELNDLVNSAMTADGGVKAPETGTDFTYDDALSTTFKVLSPADAYRKNEETGMWTDMSGDADFMAAKVADGIDVHIVGVVRPNETANASALSPGIAYTHALTRQLMERAADSQIVREQLAHPETDVFTGKTFDELQGEAKQGVDLGSMFSVDEAALKSAFSFDTSVLSGVAGGMDPSCLDLSELDIDLSGVGKDIDFSDIMSKAPAPDFSGVFDGLELTPEQMQQVGALANQLFTGFMQSEQFKALTPEDLKDASKLAAAFSTYLESDTAAQQILAQLKALGGDALAERLQQAMTDYVQKQLAPYLQQALDQMMKSISDQIATTVSTQLKAGAAGLMGQMATQMSSSFANLASTMRVDASAFARAIHFNMDAEDLSSLMMSYAKASQLTCDNNLTTLGYADEADPISVKIFPRDFEAKERVLDHIDAYNKQVKAAGHDEQAISYTDYMGIIMGSVTDIVNTISLVLIAFVSISLVVSSIMIGIITYISVLERKKEIGILRAIGASKRNVANVFNAETFIEGLIAGVFAIVVVVLVSFPVNTWALAAKQVPNLMSLPVQDALVLIAISVLLTVVAGLLPARSASKKDPVEALRSE
ncbi:ABC transporter, ATP-binding protein [Collinsella aerofaciens ATCC 25986]|uniref:ABC transporter, ATP-binding protein n=1 Tax=Collinsella aerofaciens (strain ATCC 25986 / DSM 3979 / JCM 10188 / KCTC 3647 / NCTC 11838 / VPI 1003) TaxID=411903 RepID=A4E8A1_COLAA|nr:ABC transporter ATP-binding protein/permease [Collinsella aerofaciens]EBA40117.1 ABC transporter, ATP-binding protein [Collinsella aerofaciens ATCC 25986]SUY68301.1 Macrolide export ATP-binding/permease protein MacB [Collinsella aerofaciens]